MVKKIGFDNFLISDKTFMTIDQFEFEVYFDVEVSYQGKEDVFSELNENISFNKLELVPNHLSFEQLSPLVKKEIQQKVKTIALSMLDDFLFKKN